MSLIPGYYFSIDRLSECLSVLSCFPLFEFRWVKRPTDNRLVARLSHGLMAFVATLPHSRSLNSPFSLYLLFPLSQYPFESC